MRQQAGQSVGRAAGRNNLRHLRDIGCAFRRTPAVDVVSEDLHDVTPLRIAEHPEQKRRTGRQPVLQARLQGRATRSLGRM